MSQLKLVISDDEGKTTVVPLVHGAVSIGRHESNIIRLTERNVSRRHARLRRIDGGYVLDDLGSNNGVLLNGEYLRGEQQIAPGDTIGIGDYRLAVKPDNATVKVVEGPLPAPHAGPPERLVMLTQPAPGAMYAIAREGARIGREGDVEVRINHRDVAAEHARIERRGSDAVLVDCSGRTVLNGAPIAESVLRPGDVVELGGVRLRYVPAGEEYDPNYDQTVLVQSVPPEPRTSTAVKVALLGGAGVTLFLVAGVAFGATSWFDEPASAVQLPEVASEQEAQRKARALVEDCRRAVEKLHWTEATLAAERAIAIFPGWADAVKCADQAEAGRHEQERFDRGVAALVANDVETAFHALQGLPEASALRQRPEVAEARKRYVAMHLGQAVASLDTEPETALRHARAILVLEELDEATRTRAKELEANALEPEAAEEAAPALRRPARQGALSPGERARQCLQENDPQCIVDALEGGKARSPGLLSLLIRAHRSLGNQDRARGYMEEFLQRYPEDPRADRIEEMLAAP